MVRTAPQMTTRTPYRHHKVTTNLEAVITENNDFQGDSNVCTLYQSEQFRVVMIVGCLKAPQEFSSQG
ncbi:hypothetical protein AciX9_1577 [Granulicella tundricola MP5ACTX9]|uniref:Uncharacterized protein n=1 Tax=Granulicella tundricola (strain ATCC BAA-1859 / DSM 23138 / MP5ACTX9) TaxID=1198114 RepID=E8WXL4_GRATM|nr:hypothetical protein AciX9_1577 [Granulicella tundricola MP5ACTX9]